MLDESDLDALIARLAEVGLDHDGPKDATSSRVLVLLDPDGNRACFGQRQGPAPPSGGAA